MKIKVCIPTVSRFDLLSKTVKELYKDPSVEQVVILDNSCGECPFIEGTTLHSPEKPFSVAKSWNYFYKLFPNELFVIANDDIIPHENCISHLVSRACDRELGSNVAIYFGNADGNENQIDNNYSLFCMPHWAFQFIGPFDERFYPAYYEDCDHDRRRNLAGYDSSLVVDALYSHIGSATIKQYNEEQTQEHYQNMRKNQMYYVAKWGGLPGRETYFTPFNNKQKEE